jgi:3-mercaptopyruvate sulfurtransferase SseA
MDNLEFETLTAEEFDAYLKNHPVKDYLLIDVRQESEYELGHIPGAKLMPLAEVETRLFSLPAEQDLIFYCHNLEQVADNSCFEILNLALAIEYAAFDLYRVMAEHTDHPAARETFLAIAQAEKGHMRALTRTIEKCQ